jgi:hypothetical protein
MADPIKKAAMLRLDYLGNRHEHSVIYHRFEWAKLIDLLSYPSAFLLMEQCDWPQRWKHEHLIPWEIYDPTTVVLRPISASLVDTLRTLNQLDYLSGSQLEDTITKRKDDRMIDSPRFRQSVLDGLVGDTGFFRVEFAVKTHTMLVSYSPPKQKPGGRFSGTYDSPSLVVVPGANADLKTGNLHFDIGNNPRDRAEFILDYIDKDPRIIQGILDDIHVGEANMLPPVLSAPIPNAPTSPAQRPGFKFDPGSYPVVVLEGVMGGPSDECCVCGDSPMVWDPVSKTWIFDPLQLKCYACPVGTM